MQKNIKKLIKIARQTAQKLKIKAGFAYHKVTYLINHYPLQSFFGLIGVLLLIIIVGDLLRKPPPAIKINERPPQKVSIFSIGKSPTISVQAKIEKSGVVKITALSGGIVQKLYKKEGDQVNRGTWLAWLSTNWQGGSAASATRQIAQKNYDFLKDTIDTQKEIIGKNREIAQKSEAQTSQLRDIGRQSIDDTNSLISLNEDVISMLDKQISALEAINNNGASDSAILQLKTGKASALAGLNQAKAALRSTQYQTDENNEPADITRLQRDATLKQLEIQEKSLDLNRDVALLNLRLSQIQESLMYPSSPINGVIERVYVKEGQAVTPGMLLFSITGNTTSANAVAFIPGSTSQSISHLELSTLKFNGHTFTLYPSYISQEPTEGNLHTILFALPDNLPYELTNGQIVTIELPIGSPSTSASLPFIPLDAVYQTENESYVYVVDKQPDSEIKAVSRKIGLGIVYGEYVQVTSGLKDADQIILNRNIIEGDKLTVDY